MAEEGATRAVPLLQGPGLSSPLPPKLALAGCRSVPSPLPRLALVWPSHTFSCFILACIGLRVHIKVLGTESDGISAEMLQRASLAVPLQYVASVQDVPVLDASRYFSRCMVSCSR